MLYLQSIADKPKKTMMRLSKKLGNIKPRTSSPFNKQMQDKIIVIATSCPPGRPGYRRDFLTCLCYPNAFGVRFNYRQQYFSRDILRQLASNPNYPVGRRAVLLFCDIPKDVKEDFTFLPVRFVTITALEVVNSLDTFRDLFDKMISNSVYGDSDEDPCQNTTQNPPPTESDEQQAIANDEQETIANVAANTYIALKFTLDEYVRLNEKQITSWQEWVMGRLRSGKRIPRPSNHTCKSQSCLIYEVDCPADLTPVRDLEKQPYAEDEGFRIICKHLLNMNTTEQSNLFRLVNVYKGTEGTKPVPRRIKAGRMAHVLAAGESYRIRLQYYYPTRPTVQFPQSLEMHVASQSIFFSKPIIENIGYYAYADVFATTKLVYPAEAATVVIEDPEDNNATTARADFTVLLAPPRWFYFVALLIAVALIIGTVTPEFLQYAKVPQFLGMVADNSPEQSAKDASQLVAALIRGVSTLAVIVLAFFALRKIPGQ